MIYASVFNKDHIVRRPGSCSLTCGREYVIRRNGATIVTTVQCTPDHAGFRNAHDSDGKFASGKNHT